MAIGVAEAASPPKGSTDSRARVASLSKGGRPASPDPSPTLEGGAEKEGGGIVRGFEGGPARGGEAAGGTPGDGNGAGGTGAENGPGDGKAPGEEIGGGTVDVRGATEGGAARGGAIAGGGGTEAGGPWCVLSGVPSTGGRGR